MCRNDELDEVEKGTIIRVSELSRTDVLLSQRVLCALQVAALVRFAEVFVSLPGGTAC
jgi:hypothetical protein